MPRARRRQLRPGTRRGAAPGRLLALIVAAAETAPQPPAPFELIVEGRNYLAHQAANQRADGGHHEGVEPLALGQVGVWTGVRQWPSDRRAAREIAAELEQLGFSTVWLGGGPGGSSGQFNVADALLAATTTLVVATGIVEVWSTPASEVIARHNQLITAHPGRFLLGLGAGHAEAVEPITGQQYVKLLSKLASYLDELDGDDEPVPASQRVLAALGPRMLRLAGERSAGAHTYEVTPEYTATARAALGPAPLLAPEQKLLLEGDPSVARNLGREALAVHLELPNYLNNWRRLGFDDTDFADGGSDRLVDALVAWGSSSMISRRVQDYLDAGATHVAVQVLSAAGRTSLPREEWRDAAAALLG